MLPVFAYTQQNADFNGLELEIDLTLAEWRGGDFGVKLLGDLVSGELDSGDDIPRLPPHRVGLEIGYEHQALDAFVSVFEAAKQDKPGLMESETAGYTSVDASVVFKFQTAGDIEQMQIFLRGKNLSDEEIRNSVSFLRDVAPEAGRSFEAGFRVNF